MTEPWSLSLPSPQLHSALSLTGDLEKYSSQVKLKQYLTNDYTMHSLF